MANILVYRHGADIDDLEVGECVMHRAVNPNGERYWHLWFRVRRETDGQPDTFCVPMNPNGVYFEDGPGGRTWGLTSMPESWQIHPSINVLQTRDVHPGAHSEVSLWHQTPLIVGVPDDSPWITEAP